MGRTGPGPRLGLVYKQGSRLAAEVAIRAAEEWLRLGGEVFLEESLLGDPEGARIREKLGAGTFSLRRPDVDFISVIGGDGTLLRTLHMLQDPRVPVMGIRMGRRGFLLDVAPIEVPERIRDLFEGRYSVVEYLRLKASASSGELPPALNEITVHLARLERSKVVRLKIFKDDRALFYMEGDGVIVATPIGSTGYSLSAGGPVLDHDLKGFVITPLAPVQTWLRPLVVSSSSTIAVVVAEDSIESIAIADGQASLKLPPGGRVVIRAHEEPARIIRFHNTGLAYERLFPR